MESYIIYMVATRLSFFNSYKPPFHLDISKSITTWLLFIMDGQWSERPYSCNFPHLPSISTNFNLFHKLSLLAEFKSNQCCIHTMVDLVQKVIFHYKQKFEFFTNYTIDYTVAPSFHETKPFIRIQRHQPSTPWQRQIHFHKVTV